MEKRATGLLMKRKQFLGKQNGKKISLQKFSSTAKLLVGCNVMNFIGFKLRLTDVGKSKFFTFSKKLENDTFLSLSG